MRNVIEVNGLTKIYKPLPFSKDPEVIALKNINFKVEQGTIYTILGPNGAGKTTLIQILAGLIPPTEGEIKIAGINTSNKKTNSRTFGLFTSNGKGFWKSLTGLENLEYFLQSLDLILKPGGRAAIIAFHSLEDRLVKNFFREQARDYVNLPDELTTTHLEPTLKIVTKKPIVPTPHEVSHNPRSRSAKLRIAQKV